MSDVNDPKQKILSGFGWTYAEKMCSQFITLLVSIILARILEPQHYGIIAIVLVFITVLDAIVSNGLGYALIQKKDADNLDYDTIGVFSLLLGVILYVILFFASPIISDFYNLDLLCMVIRVMGLRIIISSFNSVQQAYIQRNMEFKKSFVATLCGSLTSAVVGIVMAIYGYGVWALVAQNMTATIISTFTVMMMIRWRICFRFSIKRFQPLFGYGIKILIATLVNTFQENIRSLIVGKVFTVVDLAFYNQGQKYPSFLMNNLIGSIQRVLLPVFSNEQDNGARIKQQMRKGIRISSFLLVPIVIGIVATADNIVVTLLTSKWLPCVPYMRILSLIYLTRTMNTIFQSALLAIGRSDINLLHEFVGSILSILFIFYAVFVAKSVLLLAWGSVLVMLVGTAIFMFFVKSCFCYSFLEIAKDYVPILIISVIMGLSTYYLGNLLQVYDSVFVLPIQMLIGIISYVGLAEICGFKELDVLKIMVRNFVKRREYSLLCVKNSQ